MFLVGEGPCDIGDLANPPPYRDAEDPREGFLQPTLRRLVGDDIELSFFDGRKLTTLAGGEKRQPRHWLQRRKASQALTLASVLGADVLVFSCDIDKGHGKQSEHERRARLADIRQSIVEGFEHVRELDPTTSQILTAIAVPARMIEAWALGDRDALAALLDVEVDTLAYKPPEELWGDGEDPSSNHPKQTWHRVTDGSVSFSEIGEAADPAVLREACPDSYGAFAEDVDGALERCPQARGKGGKRRTRR